MTVMSAVIEISDTEWALVEDLFDPPGPEGKPAQNPRRDVVDAILFLARTGCQWLPPGLLPTLGSGLAAVAALAKQRRLGEGDDAPRHPDPHPQRPDCHADHGDD